MKLYIVCDVSRISGILGGGNGLPPWFWFPDLEKDDLRIEMTGKINGAARVARQIGATEILVHEACPVDMVSLDEEVKLIRGGSRLYLDKSFAGIAFIGQGLAKHVASSNGIENNIRKIEFNGHEVDEMTICSLYAGSIGVPTICASGDSGCFKILKRFMPGLITHKNSWQAMTSGLEKIGKARPIALRGRIEITFHFGSETLATMHTRLSNVVKTGKTTTRVRATNMPEAFDAYCSCGLVASVDWLNSPNVHKSCKN
ncbi:MAG: M55 family metallopeptidase [Verrucomicrobia bacterium]|nr:M55 family metallopeptidase [Verrucomicrobiota bacterium]MBU1733638.1 M55 family metallopeptidase [Verrucomicrobiota bacterium]MBU1857581.1 M55 family metallopeptidase [Verrucomicrobiota bacterium]